MKRFCIIPAACLAACCIVGHLVTAQSSGMDLVTPQHLDIEPVASIAPIRPIDGRHVAQNCAQSQVALRTITLSRQKAGNSIDVARADFDMLRPGQADAWLFVLDSVDSIYADPDEMKLALRDGRWLRLCRERLGGG